MNLPDFSVRRPIFTSMVMSIIVVLGLFALRGLKVDLFPSVELPTVSIRTGYEGANPEIVENQVTQIIEEIVATVPGVEQISSTSTEGRSNIRVQFEWGTDINSAALETQSKLEDEISELPEEVLRPQVSKFDLESVPVVVLGISGNLDPVELTDLVNNQIRQRFSMLPGVAQVDLFGGYNPEVRVELDRAQIEALGLPLNTIIQALRNANVDRPSGNIEEGTREVTLRAPAQFQTIDQIRDTVITIRDGNVVTLGQIADVYNTHERITRLNRVNGERGLRVGIRKQSSANTVDVSRAILKEIEEVNRDYPQVRIVAVSNSGNFIERSIANVSKSVLYGGALSVLVLLFFLRNWRSTFIISAAIPISIIATFALLYFGGFTLNLMSLGGLALGVGMMVDSSIVVLENIFRRYKEESESPEIAASRGASEVATAILASTLTTLVIFLPVVFIQGVSGQLFSEMAYVVSFSLICSLFVSLSLVPMLSAKLLKPKGRSDAATKTSGAFSGIAAKSEKWFLKLEDGYRSLLASALDHRYMVVWGSIGALAYCIALAPMIGTEFMPPSDEGEVSINGELEVGTRLDIVDNVARRVEDIVVASVPEMVANVMDVSTGQFRMSITLNPASARTRSNNDVANDLRRAMAGQFPGIEMRVQARQGQFLLNRLLGGGGGGGFGPGGGGGGGNENANTVQVEVRGYELSVLEALADQAEDVLADIPGVVDIVAGFREGNPQQELRVNREKAGDLGLTVSDVTQILQIAVAGSRAGEFRRQGVAYPIRVQMAGAQRLSIDEVLDLTMRTPAGELVALRNVVETSSGRAAQSIQRLDQQRLVSISASIEGRPMGEVAREIQTALDSVPRPSGYIFNLAGSYEEQQKSTREFLMAMVLSLLLVFMVLACQYESLKDPLIVMVATPMAAIGVIVTLVLTKTTLNLQSGIGCIMLGGIVVNNAILLVDQASRLLQEGMPTRQAITESGRRRLRPILMTTLTTALGLLPLALGIGEGADAQAPLARAVIGGLVGSTLITLVLTPVVFSFAHAKPKAAAPIEVDTFAEARN